MKALVLEKKGEIILKEVPLPRTKKGEALIRVKACGICGSDIPRIFGDVAYYYPSIPGHEFSGEIIAVGEGTENRSLLGKRVTVFPLLPCGQCRYCESGYFEICDHYGYIGSRQDGAFAEYVVVPLKNCLELPDNVSYECGALTEPSAVTFHGLQRLRPPFAGTVAVFGLGPIGVLFGFWAKTAGATALIGFDVDEVKLSFAKSMIFDDVQVPNEENTRKMIEKYTAGIGFDYTVEASGNNHALVNTLKIVRKLGEVLLLGNQEKEVKLTSGEMNLILRKELTLRGTWNSCFAQLGSDWKSVLEYQRLKKVDFSHLISHRIFLEEAPQVLRAMRDRKLPYTKVLIIPGGGIISC